MILPRILILSLTLLLTGPLSAAPTSVSASAAAPVGAVPDRELESAIRARLFEGPLGRGQQPDPETPEWEQARAAGTRADCNEVGPLRYLPTTVDLNADGIAEVLTVVVGSHACGSGGCTLLIFRRGDDGLETIHESGLFQSPLRMLPERRNGWPDLSMPGSSYGVSSGVMELRFDGQTYRASPGNPSGEPVPSGPDSPPLLTLPAVAFENLGLPLACAP